MRQIDKSLSIQQGDKDSASTGWEIFEELKARGLEHSFVNLGIMESLPDTWHDQFLKVLCGNSYVPRL
jgi:arginine decarboxylase-like protein